MREYKIRKQLLSIGFALFCLLNIKAQSIKVKSATSQDWAGGICCIHGTNYNINLHIVRSKHVIILDTLWLEGYGTDLSEYNQKKIKQRDTININIHENRRTDDSELGPYVDLHPDLIGYNEDKIGVILQYRMGGKKISLNISPYIKELEFLAYP